MTNLLDRIETTLLRPVADLMPLNADEQFELIASRSAGIANSIVTSHDLLEKLRASKSSGRPLRIKFGIDPTGPDIHVGHAVSLLNLRLFQRMGHQIVLVIGDFTGLIGDPSGRASDRPALTREQIVKNMASYESQAARIIDLSDTSVERHYNTSWMNKLSLSDWAGMLRKIPASALLQREDFRNRLEQGFGLSMAELEYAIFMAYDSVVLKADVELGGVDQYLNMHMCRQLMQNEGQAPETIIAYNLLSGTTGERDEHGRLAKMSKSKGNYIPITATPDEMYGKTMSIPDDVMWTWYRELTEIGSRDLAELKTGVDAGNVHPKDVKRLLARAIVATFHNFSMAAVEAGERDFDSKFGKNTDLIPKSTVTIQASAGLPLLDALALATSRSKSDIRRLAQQGGLRILNDTEYVPLSEDDLAKPALDMTDRVLRIGKRQYFRVQAK